MEIKNTVVHAGFTIYSIYFMKREICKTTNKNTDTHTKTCKLLINKNDRNTLRSVKWGEVMDKRTGQCIEERYQTLYGMTFKLF